MLTPPYPIFLQLRGVPVLVVGGGKVAARKINDLIESGASITVVSPEFDAAISGKLNRVKRPYKASDLTGKRLVFAATNDPELNARICAAAHKKGIWANCAAPPEAGNFAVPSMVQKGSFCLAISTGGASPALSAHWRERLEKLVGDEWGDLVGLLEKKRKEVKARVADPNRRRELLSELGKPHWAAKLKRWGLDAIERRMDALIDRKTIKPRKKRN